MLAYLLQLLPFSLSHTQPKTSCKATPGSPNWPTLQDWSNLNTSLHGQLLQPSPPGAICHPSSPFFAPLQCPSLQAAWLTSSFHTSNPISCIANNWNNDTCLPIPTAKCSGEGYPVYVVNATGPEDVKKGVDFARENGIRLVVKGTGHDYLGRSSAPNSLSIWTHHLIGLEFHDGFRPKGCKFSIEGAAITAGAGTQMLELDEQAHLRNLTIVSRGAGTVGVGGYLTGGGHAALSSTYGLGADNVLELEMVTPGGDILTTNECQNEDLFWAMRGGGGSTFGILTSVTIRAFPSAKFHTITAYFATLPGTEAYWDALTQVISSFPSLDARGISAYTEIVPGYINPAANVTSLVDVFQGIFMLPALHPSNTSDSLLAAVSSAFSVALDPYPMQFFTSVVPTSYDDFWGYYKDNNGPLNAGFDAILGSRLLDEKALTGNLTASKEAYKAVTPSGSSTGVFLVGGKGVMDAKPRGGSNAVSPTWRRAFVHTVLSASWSPFDTAGKAKVEDLITNTYVAALKKLAPEMGAYVNEADPNDPNFQESFWGENYPRLLEIKKKYDPWDVLWCTPCVGNEEWKEIDGVLCKV